MNRRKVGTEQEAIAAEYLKKQGMKILEMNFRIRSGEIDIIAKEKTYLVFAEVKYRTNDKMGTAAEAVNLQKQKKIRQTAQYYLQRYGYPESVPCRFDVVAIENGRIIHIRNAFEA